MPNLHVYEMDDGCVKNWYVAQHELEAAAMAAEDTGLDEDEFDIRLLADDEPLTIVQVDEHGRPKVTALAKEWAKRKGLLASTEEE